MAQGVPPSPTGPAVSGAEVLVILQQLSTEIRGAPLEAPLVLWQPAAAATCYGKQWSAGWLSLQRATACLRADPELDVGNTVPRVPNLTALEFLREYVGPNKPVVLTDATSHWPAHELWTDEYLLQTVGDVEVRSSHSGDAVTQHTAPAPLFHLQMLFHFQLVPPSLPSPRVTRSDPPLQPCAHVHAGHSGTDPQRPG